MLRLPDIPYLLYEFFCLSRSKVVVGGLIGFNPAAMSAGQIASYGAFPK
jgi:hypothetical protein